MTTVAKYLYYLNTKGSVCRTKDIELWLANLNNRWGRYEKITKSIFVVTSFAPMGYKTSKSHAKVFATTILGLPYDLVGFEIVERYASKRMRLSGIKHM